MIIPFIFINVTIFLAAAVLVYRYLPDSRFSEKWLAIFLAWVLQISLSILFLGTIIRNLGIPALVGLNLAISLFILIRLRSFLRSAISSLCLDTRKLTKFLLDSRDYILYFLILVFLLQAGISLFKVYYLPPRVHDVFTYHLHPVVEWFQRGEIPMSLDSPVWRVNRNPLGAKLLQFWFTAFAGNLAWSELPQLLYGLALVPASCALMLKLNVQRLTALRYGILIYFIPSVIIQSSTNQDHLTLTALTVIALLFFINTFYENRPGQSIPLAAAMGLLMGTKLNSPQFLFVFFLAMIISKGFNGKKIINYTRRHWKILAVAVGLIILVCGYWFGKNLFQFGHLISPTPPRYLSLPFLAAALLGFVAAIFIIRGMYTFLERRFPGRARAIITASLILLAIAGSSIWLARHWNTNLPPAAAIEKLKKESKTFANIANFPVRIKDPGPYAPDLANISGFGIAFLVFGLPAFIIVLPSLLFRESIARSRAGFLATFAVLLLLTYFTYYSTDFNYRLFLFFPVIGLVLWADILSRKQWLKPKNGFVDVLVIIMVLFNGIVCLTDPDMYPSKLKSMITLEDGSKRSMASYSPLLAGQDWQYIDNYIPSDEPIAYHGGRDSWVLPYFDMKMNRRIYFLRSLPGFKTKRYKKGKRILVFTRRLKENLKQRGIHYIHLNPQGAVPGNRLSIRENQRGVLKITRNLYYFK